MYKGLIPTFWVPCDKTIESTSRSTKIFWSKIITYFVLWFGTRVTCEMVSDGGGRFIPAKIVGLHTLYLLLASLVAHGRATEDNHTHHTGRVSYTNIKEGTLPNRPLVSTVHNPGQGGINSVSCE